MRGIVRVLLRTVVMSGCGFLGASWAAGEVTVASVFGDNMVIQREMKVPVWGTAAPGEKVTVTLGDRTARATADDDGRWALRLRPLKAVGPHEMTVAGRNTLKFRDVLVGEVWVGSGQSNMAWPLSASANADAEIAAAKYPELRLFQVEKKAAETPLESCGGSWVPCASETARNFSAVAYFFGRHLHRELGVPVGLIETAWGGTPAESWTSRPTLESNPDFAPMLERWEKAIAGYEENVKKYPAALKEWEDGPKTGEKPKEPNPPSAAWRPSALYNGMIAPLVPYAIRGAIWYQGESNAGRAYQYRKLFPAMIRDWRESWGQGDFPFHFVQLANFHEAKPEPGDSGWAELREAQLMTLALPKTGMAVIIDIGDAADIHPKNKQDVGKRLALAALATAYGKDIVFSGPIYDSMKVEGGRIRLRFEHADGGLVAKGGGQLTGFAIAGADRKFVWADAEIDGKTVIVHSDQVNEPIAVRYAWADNPTANLYNAADLAASPFRTDDWPGVTVNER